MRTRKEMKELDRKLLKVCEAVRNRFKLGSNIDISWSYGIITDGYTYRNVIPSDEDTITIQLRPRK